MDFAGHIAFFSAPLKRPDGGIGRRAGLKILFPQGSVGSTPTLGTISKTRFISGFCCFCSPGSAGSPPNGAVTTAQASPMF